MLIQKKSEDILSFPQLTNILYHQANKFPVITREKESEVNKHSCQN